MLRTVRPHVPTSTRLARPRVVCLAHPASVRIISMPRRSLAPASQRFATAPPQSTNAPQEGEMPLPAFHKIADRTIEEYQEEMNKMQDVMEDLDMEYGMGVLTVRMGPKGTYVINKQTPARQIWLSSPVSGPKRYMYSFEKRQWRNTRDGHALADILSEELTKLSGVQLRLRDPEV